jgi:EcsC protein family
VDSELTATSHSLDNLQDTLLALVSGIPESTESRSDHPHARARRIAKEAAMKSATYSATLALPPGPLGIFTVLPDLLLIWQIQKQLVSDVAACYGKNSTVTKEVMLYCLFRHAAVVAVRDIVIRVGERVLVRRVALRSFQEILSKIGIRITQKTIGSTVSRWIPFVGAAGIGAYSYFDTWKVGKTAMELFSEDIRFEEEEMQGHPAIQDAEEQGASGVTPDDLALPAPPSQS